MKKDILVIAGLFCIVLIIFFRVIFFNPEIDHTLKSFLPWHNNFPEASGVVAKLDWTQYDLLTFNYPIWKTAVDQIKKLELPLWNPYQMSGNSLLAAGQSNILDPFNLMVFLVSPETTYKIKIVIIIFLIALFTYIYARAINLSMSGSAIASIIFSFSGFCYEYQYFLPHTMAYAFFPLLLVFIHKSIFSASKIFYAVTGGLFLGIISLTAIIQYPIYYIVFTGIYIIFFNSYRYDGTDRLSFSWSAVSNSLFIITIFIITGLSIGAMHLLPVAVLGFDSYRLASTFGHHFPIIGLFQFLFPRLLFHPFSTPTFNNSFLSYIGAIFNKDIGLGNIDLNWYLGIFPLILVFIAVYRIRTALSIFYTFSMIIIFLITISILRLPAVEGMNHMRILHIFTFSTAILSGMGLDYILKKSEGFDRVLNKIMSYLKKIIIVISISLVIIISLLTLCEQYLMGIGHEYVGNLYTHRNTPFPVEYYYHEFDDLLYHSRLIFIEHLYLPVLLSLIYLSLKINLSFKSERLYLFKGLIFLIILTDLLFVGYSYGFPRKEISINYPVTESIKFLLKQNKPFRIYIDQSPINIPDKRFKEVSHEVPMLIMPANLPTIYGLENVSGIESLFHKRYLHFFWQNIEEKKEKNIGKNVNYSFLNLLNVKYILTNRVINENNMKLVYDNEIKIYENMNVMPRVFTVYNARVIREQDKILSALSENDFDPRKELIIEDEIPYLHAGKEKGEMDSKTEIIKYSPSRIVIKADMKKDGFLFLGDIWDTGWKVFVDNHESKIFRTNYIFRSVFLPEGSHHVEFVYKPIEVKIGFIISATSLIICILYYFFYFRKRRSNAIY